jgi:hypothetical protein
MQPPTSTPQAADPAANPNPPPWFFIEIIGLCGEAGAQI